MSRPLGFDHFIGSLAGFEDQFVVIGGGAAAILMDEQNLEFRPTKDVDLVLLTNDSPELNAKISEYVQLGKYAIREATKGSPRYYRFRDPENKDCPVMIEIFARNERQIELRDGQYIIPVQNDAIAQISAILLDEEYFALIKANRVQMKSGASVINAVANICLKARAHRELSERKAKGEPVDEKDIKKHRHDILRLAVNLTGQEKPDLGPTTKADLKLAFELLYKMEKKQFKQIMERQPGAEQDALLDLLGKVFPTT